MSHAGVLPGRFNCNEPISTTTVNSGGLEGSNFPPLSITSLSLTPNGHLMMDWEEAMLNGSSGVTQARHDSHSWPIIPSIHCWFCPPETGGRDVGLVIPGVVEIFKNFLEIELKLLIGSCISPHPPPEVRPPSGSPCNMPSITLASSEAPIYDTAEPF